MDHFIALNWKRECAEHLRALRPDLSDKTLALCVEGLWEGASLLPAYEAAQLAARVDVRYLAEASHGPV